LSCPVGGSYCRVISYHVEWIKREGCKAIFIRFVKALPGVLSSLTTGLQRGILFYVSDVCSDIRLPAAVYNKAWRAEVFPFTFTMHRTTGRANRRIPAPA